MPDYKNQHFVPRCYFRSFSLDEQGRSVCLYNISTSRAVRRASIRGQCARPWLYGEDLHIERSMQQFEEAYTRVLRRLRNEGKEPTKQDLITLRDFMMLQFSRTEAAINRTTSAIEDVSDTVRDSLSGSSVNPPELHCNDRTMMLMTLGMFTDLRKSVSDLRICLFKNETSQDFVTSDDPVAFMSRFHAQKIRSNVFGIGSAGALFYFPLSPRLLLLCYDGDVYIPRNRKTH